LGEITSLQHISPHAIEAERNGEFGPTGFTLARSPDNLLRVVGFQNITDSSLLPLYDLGVQAGSFAAEGITPHSSTRVSQWDAELLLARGTYLGSFESLGFDLQGPNFGANVFASRAGVAVRQPESILFYRDGEQLLSPPSMSSGAETPGAETSVVDGQPSVSEAQPSVPPPKFDPFAYSGFFQPDTPASVTLSRRSRPVTSEEIAGGAPEGYVHEFFVTSSTDVLGIRDVGLTVPAYQHRFGGADYRAPNAKILMMFPGVPANSFVDTPGPTRVLGSFPAASGGEDAASWYDQTNDGPQDEFLFARLTVDETGYFSGAIGVSGPNGPVELPFNFVLPGTTNDLALIDQDPEFSLAFPSDHASDLLSNSALGQIPEPSAILLAAVSALLCTKMCRTNGSVQPQVQRRYRLGAIVEV
jgi:hypothetical protein